MIFQSLIDMYEKNWKEVSIFHVSFETCAVWDPNDRMWKIAWRYLTSKCVNDNLFSYSGLQQPNKSSILKDGIYVIAQVHSRIARSLPLFMTLLNLALKSGSFVISQTFPNRNRPFGAASRGICPGASGATKYIEPQEPRRHKKWLRQKSVSCNENQQNDFFLKQTIP